MGIGGETKKGCEKGGGATTNEKFIIGNLQHRCEDTEGAKIRLEHVFLQRNGERRGDAGHLVVVLKRKKNLYRYDVGKKSKNRHAERGEVERRREWLKRMLSDPGAKLRRHGKEPTRMISLRQK